MKNLKIYYIIFLVLLLVTWVSRLTAQQFFQTNFEQLETSQENKLKESFKSYKVFLLDFSQINQYVKERHADDNIILNLNINNSYKWQLILQPNDMRAIGYKSVVTSDDGETEQQLQAVNTYKGFLNGNENDIVRLTISDNNISGYIFENGELHYIEPLSNFISDAKKNQLIMYSPVDVINKETFSCGVTEIENQKNNFNNDLPNPNAMPCGENEVIVVEIATEADFEYFGLFGANTNNHILGILNEVEGVYLLSLNLRFRVTFQHVWTTANNPLTSTDGNTLLNQFRDDWNTNMTNVNRDLAHLWTGKELDGTLIGLAWTGVVCLYSGNAYGLSQVFIAALGEFVLTAHEIGHNFNGNHDHGVSCGNQGSIMCTPLEIWSFYFSAASINNITTFISDYPDCYDCYPCLPNENITTDIPSTSNIYVERSDYITASSTIESGATVTLDAGNQIVLQPGFHAEAGSHFRAFIDGCSGINFKTGNGENSGYNTAASNKNQDNENNQSSITNQQSAISLHPNPTSSTFTIQGSYAIPATIELYDLTGRQVYRQAVTSNRQRVDVSQLAGGLYVYRLVSGGKVARGKIILE